MASRAILSNFFEEQRTQNHPQHLSGLSRALFPTTFLEIAVYLHFLFCAVPVFVAEHGLGSCPYPSLCPGSRSSGCDTSLELPFIAWVAFRLDFMAGIILHFIFIACVASSCFIEYVAFSCYGMCGLHVGFSWRVSPVSHFWRESLSLVSWCLSYFALHFVFIACVAYKLFLWSVSPSGCFFRRVSPSS